MTMQRYFRNLMAQQPEVYREVPQIRDLGCAL